MERQIIITLGRRIGAGGLEIAHTLAGRLGIKVYDKELIEIAAEESGLAPDVFEKTDEVPASKSRFARFFGQRSSNYVDTRSYSPDSAISEDDLFKTQSDIIRQIADAGSGIFVGRCADYVLRDKPNVVSVYIEAPRRFCVERTIENMHVSEEVAHATIERTDKFRADYYKYYTHGNYWTNPVNYDMTLNSERVGIDDCVRIIEQYLELKGLKKSKIVKIS